MIYSIGKESVEFLIFIIRTNGLYPILGSIPGLG